MPSTEKGTSVGGFWVLLKTQRGFAITCAGNVGCYAPLVGDELTVQSYWESSLNGFTRVFNMALLFSASVLFFFGGLADVTSPNEPPGEATIGDNRSPTYRIAVVLDVGGLGDRAFNDT